MMSRVVIAAEIGFYRDGLAYVLPRHQIEVAGVAATAAETVACTADLAPDVVLLDIGMERSLQAVRAIASAHPQVKVVALGVHDREPDLLACIEAGAVGYVTRDGSLHDVIDSIKRAISGEPLASPQMIATLMRRVALLATHTQALPPATTLTSRELEVVDLIDQGLSNKQIAARLCIEVATVKNHVHNILEKLNVRRRGEAAAHLRGAQLRGSPPAQPDLAAAR